MSKLIGQKCVVTPIFKGYRRLQLWEPLQKGYDQWVLVAQGKKPSKLGSPNYLAIATESGMLVRDFTTLILGGYAAYRNWHEGDEKDFILEPKEYRCLKMDETVEVGDFFFNHVCRLLDVDQAATQYPDHDEGCLSDYPFVNMMGEDSYEGCLVKDAIKAMEPIPISIWRKIGPALNGNPHYAIELTLP